MTKGADSIMMPRINFTTKDEQILAEKINKDLFAFAVEGLRTLVMGKRRLSNKEYKEFADEFQRLKTSTDKNKDEQLNELFN